MNHLPTGLATFALLAGSLLAIPALIMGGNAATPATPVAFGMDANSVAAQTNAGVKPDYGTFWIGPWTLSSGWAGPDGQLDSMKAAGVTPAVHFYYWGDDISQSCLENGCWSSLHNAQKDKAHWQTLAQQLVDHLNSRMAGKPVVVFVETEFNKGDVSTYEALDGYLADKAHFIRNAYPAAKIVMPLGNWGSTSWGTWDRFAGASDFVGIQGMRGSTRQSQTDMYTLYDGLLAGVKTLEAKFPGKAIMLTDIAVSSYPEPSYLAVQGDVIKEVFDNLATLKANGVTAMIYRTWLDNPTMNTANYYGMAERYWGLANAHGVKPSAQVWIDGVKAERSATPPTSNAAPIASFVASANGATASVDAAASSDPDGDALTFAWTFGDGATATGRTSSHAYTASGTYTIGLGVNDGKATTTASRSVTITVSSTAYAATFTTNPASNEYWVQEHVTSSPAPSKVQVSVNGGAWQSMTLQSYGDWTVSVHIAKGTPVAFRATAPDGQIATSASQAWLGAAPPATTFTATFAPKNVGNDYWVEAAVSANAAIAKVEAKIGSGAYAPLAKQSWGNYAASLHAPNGSQVTFRATSASGATATSSPVTWT